MALRIVELRSGLRRALLILEPRARRAVAWAALTPAPWYAYVRLSRSRGARRIAWAALLVSGLALGAVWLVKVGWALVLVVLPASAAYSSAIRGRRAGLRSRTSQGIEVASRGWPRPARALARVYSLSYRAAEALVDPPASALVLGLSLGVVGPAAAYALSRPARRSRVRSAILGGLMLIGLPWGLLWLIRVGWLLGIISLTPAALISSLRRRVALPPPVVEVGAPPAPPEEVPVRPIPAARVAWAVMILQALLVAGWLLRTDSIVNPDNAYHVLIAKMIAERGFFLWDDVQFAPAGRPHLYPPLFHIMIASLGRALGLGPWGFVLANDLASAGVFASGLYVTWYVGRKLYGDLGGLLAFVMVAGTLFPALSMAIGLPSTLVFILAPLASLWLTEGRLIPALLASSAAMYSHTSGIVIVPVALLITGALSGRLRDALKVTLAAALLYLPWLVRLVAFAGWFRFPERDIQVRPEPAILVPAAIGTIASLRRARERAVQLGYLASLAPVFATYEGRALIQGGIAFALVGVTVFVGILKRTPPRWRRRLTVALILFYLIFPAEPSALLLGALANVRPGDVMGSGFTWGDAREVASALVEAGVREGEVVHFDSGERGCAVAVFAPIRIDGGMWGEVSPPDTGAEIGENVRFMVTRLPRGAWTDLGNLRIVAWVGDDAIIELLPGEPGGVNVTDLLMRISESAQRASDLLGRNLTAAADELGRLRLLLTSAYLALRDLGVEDAEGVLEVANGAGWLAAVLGEPDAGGAITPQQIEEFRAHLLDLASMAEAWASGGPG